MFSTSSAVIRWCVECTDERVFEVPPCEDGHGEDCLDLSCMECGHAVVTGVLVADRAAVLVDRAA